MDYNILDQMFNKTFKMTMIPVAIIENKRVLKQYSPTKNWIDLKRYTESLLDEETSCKMILTQYSLAYGLIQCKNSPYKLLFGPVRAVPINNTKIRNILIENDLSLDLARELKALIESLPKMLIEYFALLLSSFYINVNHENIEVSKILEQIQPLEETVDVDDLLQRSPSQLMFGAKSPHNTYDYEQKMLFCVRNGLVDELHRMGSIGEDSRIEETSSDQMRHYKNLLIAQKTLISRAAIEGGVDPETAYSLSDLYTVQIEGITSMKYLASMSYAIRDDFCKLVKSVKHPTTNDLKVNQAIAYILENVHERITTSNIAKHLGISREYLSSKFKKTTGLSIPDFINNQKIVVAKNLLRYTSKSLVEISNYLSFSSQSHFQTQFKSRTNLTPLEYRNKKTA